MTRSFFSDREMGPRPRTVQQISSSAWGGIVQLIRTMITDGSFGNRFPEECPDGQGVCGTNTRSLGLALQSLIPELEWPLDEDKVPPTHVVMDLMEFCHDSVAHPEQVDYHSYFGHHHLSFDVAAGHLKFRESINLIFMRNGLAYSVTTDGKVERLVPAELAILTRSEFATGDAILDDLLDIAISKFLDPDPSVRRESLEQLWDAWERLKSLEVPSDKARSITVTLNKAADKPNFRAMLEAEARSLTAIGNSHRIRHSEITQEPIERDVHVDYLFHRMAAMIRLLIASR